MRKVLNALFLVTLVCLGSLSAAAAEKAFTIDCSLEFENDLDGWKIEGTALSRNTGDFFGQGADTPDYVLGGSNATSADVIFTPLKKLAAGKPYTIEFAFNTPGGTPPTLFHYAGTTISVCTDQAISAKVQDLGKVVSSNINTTGWVKCSFTFTPETEGEYCFAIQCGPYSDSMANRCGWVGFDSFIVEGTEVSAGGEEPEPPVVEPGDGKAFTIDCSLEFEDDLDGWKIEGTALSRNTGDFFGQGADTPDYVLGGSNATSADIIFTPLKKLAAGKPYTIEFAFNTPGGTPPTLFHYAGTTISVCTDQAISAKVQDLGKVVSSNTNTTGWVKCSFTFTPETEGEYCFAIQCGPYSDSMANRCGWVGFDSFIIEGTEVSAGGEEPEPPVVEPGDGKAFTIDCSLEFEDDLDGWKIDGTHLSRNTADWFGHGADTPAYVLGGSSATSADVIYTPLKKLVAGKPCTIEFAFNSPGGSNVPFHYGATEISVCSSQSIIDKVQDLGKLNATGATGDWIKCTYTFTPETTGEYCFAIQPKPYTDSYAHYCGWVGFDSFIIEGTEATEGEEPEPPVVEPGDSTPFTIDCSLEFDDDLDGWKIEGTALSRNTGDFFGQGADTPAYVLGGSNATSADIIFSPLKKLAAGKPYTIEFAFNSPGGNPANLFHYAGTTVSVCTGQAISAKVQELGKVTTGATTGWIKCSFTFTPETEGEYCFAIQCGPYTDAMANRCGWVGFDSFIIEGSEVSAGGEEPVDPPVVEPGEEKAFSIDCSLEFEDDLDGWKIDGTHLSRNTADWFGHGADTPTYVLGGSNATSADIIYTPLKKLVAGKPCTIEFAFNSPGGSNVPFHYGGTTISVCSSQSIADKVQELGKLNATGATGDWIKCTYTFTPATTGEYCFAIQTMPYSDNYASYCGWVGFDSFYIEGTEDVSGTGNVAQGTPFEKTFTFDNDEDFPGVNVLPVGWFANGIKPFRRTKAATLGIPAPPSGEYVIGVNGAATKLDNIVATEFFKLEGGIPANFSFHYSAKSGSLGIGYGFKIFASSTQSIENAIEIGSIEEDPERSDAWFESETFTFTPEADGKYCFIIAPRSASGYGPGGAVAYDNITVSGSEVEIAEPITPPAGMKPATFTIDCDLEDAADLEGWKVTGPALTRNTGSFFGLGANTPDYIIGGSSVTSDNMIFSPVKTLVAGEPCTISFYFNTPGGSSSIFNYGASIMSVCTSQSLDSKVKDLGRLSTGPTNGWKECTFTFTPETDGEYCFAIQVQPYMDTMAIQCGMIGFDSFHIEGTTYEEDGGEEPEFPVIELEPNPDHLADCIEVPYLEDFNGANYDGTSYLPKGWTSTGTVGWVTSSHRSVQAVEGDWYLVAPHNTSSERDDRCYTPFMNLEAGKTYTIEYHVYMQGNRWNEDDILYLPTLAFTVGTEQEADFHNTLATFSKECTEWVARSHTFTPEKSGPYCFGFMLSGPTNSGYVFLDALKITGEGLIPRVEPGFIVKGVSTLYDSDLTIGFKGEPIKFVNTSKYAESYKWTATGAEPASSTEANPEFTFPTDGEYNIVMEATNAKGSRKTQRKINVKLLDEYDGNQYPLTYFNGNQDRLMGTGETPAFDTDPTGDFVTGYNHYYFDLAQRFDFTREAKLDLNQLTVTITNRRFRGMTEFYDDQRIRPFSLVIYGAKEDGSLDEDNVLGRKDGTIGEILGSSGLYSFEAKDIPFAEPIVVSGTFYIAMHFDRGMEVIPQSTDLGRSYISTQTIKHGDGVTTLYAKPIDKPATSLAVLNEWNRVDALDSRLKGIGGYWILWAKMHGKPSGVTAIGADGSIVFAAAFFGQNLNVSGTTEGETIEVYNLRGIKVASAVAEEGATVIPADGLASGLYIVKSGDKATKVIK